MYATQDLRNEHEGIKIAIAVLDRLAFEIKSGKMEVVDDAEELIDFLKTFADRCHHGKEEDLLFPAMEKAGFPREGGPIGVMLAEHTRGREFIRRMSESIPAVRRGDVDAILEFVDAAHGYAALLSSHIDKENNVLFVMAEKSLPSAEHERLTEGFECIEQERIGPGVHQRYHAMLNRLEAKYLAA
ncbi:MAG: hemerythrin domain-containing protein [Armatimonadota bacterium]